MTTAVKEKKPFLPQRKPQVQPAGGAVALRGRPAARATSALAPLTIGGDPRVHLLPAGVTERKKVKNLKRRLLFAGAFVVVLVIAGYGLATVVLSTAQAQLDAAHSATAALLTQQAKFGDVTKVNADAAAIQQAQKTATAHEILWAPYLSTIEATLPSGGAITGVNASMDAPFGGTPGGSAETNAVPLQGPRIATVVLTVRMPQGDIPAWLNALPSLKGFVDATPNSVASSSDGVYVAVVTLHINDKAISDRFTKAAGTKK
jgi:type IV pilus assembly protein PilN